MWDAIKKIQPLKEVGKFIKRNAPSTAPVIDRIEEAVRQARRDDTPVVPAVQRAATRGAAEVAFDAYKPWIVGGAAVVALVLFVRKG